MTKYNCERCLKDFSQKSHYDKHNKRKTPCQDNKNKIIEVVKNIITDDFEKKLNSENILEESATDKMNYIDLFAGIGGFHQALKALGCECVLACDIDKSCQENYLENYGIKPISNVRDIDPQKIPDFDIICGGFPCFIAGTKILTNHGYKNIEDVELDDKLMTHTGNFKRIVNLQQKTYNNKIYSIKIKYHPTYITCTEEHPFYIRQKMKTWNNTLKKYEYTFKTPEWKKAHELSSNHYFGMKINEKTIIPEFNFEKKVNKYNTKSIKITLDDPDMWFMMGYFIGDGWIEETKKNNGRDTYKIRFAINTTDEPYVLNKINKILPITNKNCSSASGSCNKFGCADFVWFNIFKQFGKYAHGKLIPEWVQDAPIEFIQEFIDGYRLADGCINKNNCYSFTTVSYNLAFGLQRLYLKLGHLFSINKTVRAKTTMIEGRTVNQRDTYQIRGYIKKNKRKYSSFIENGYVWYAPFKQEVKEDINSGIPVYNFEVEDDNSYIVENTIVHNCQPFSNGGKKKTFDDDRGLLFDEIIRIAKVKKPKFMFLENVKHILKVSDGEVIEYIKNKLKKTGYALQIFQISPHNYGVPQQRERVYFVCVRNDIYNKKEIQLQPYTGEKMNFKNFLEDVDSIDSKYFIKGDILNVLEAWDEMIKIFEVDEIISPTILVHDAYRNYSDEEFEDLAQWRKDYITKNKRIFAKYEKQFDAWYKKHLVLLSKREIYGKLEWQVGKIKPNDSIFNYFIQIRQSGIRVKKAEYFPTLVAISQIPIYGKEKRYITPRECARLQSFPESLILHPNDRKSYKHFGNSVNVDNVSNVISSTFKHYGMV